MHKFNEILRGVTALVLLLLVTSSEAVGQQMPGLGPPSELALQSLRPYWHVFAAYAIAIVLVMVWAGSIAKRLGDVESRLSE